jgi:arginyl-tRNA synthetase
MLNIFSILKKQFINAIEVIASEHRVILSENDLKNFTVEPIKDKKNGDIACNIAMTLIKKFKDTELKNVELLANSIATQILKTANSVNKIEQANCSLVHEIKVAKAGFINIFLTQKILLKVLADIVIIDKINYPNLGNQVKVNLEYASPNPTGPIHVGHTRGSIYGDVLANLLQKVGYDVLKEYYINDSGSQILTLLRSVFKRYQQACGIQINEEDFLKLGLYPGEYLAPIAKKLFINFKKELLNLDENQYFPIIRNLVVDDMVELIKNDLLALGIKHDSYFSEKKELHDKNKIADAIEVLKKHDLVYVGKLSIPMSDKGVGQHLEDYDESDQTLFRSTNFGDDVDRVVIKADGSYTYLAGDMAYTLSKFERGARIFIMPLGYDHAGYVKRLNAVVESLTNNQASLKVILCQMVKFVKDGQPLKMSKRAGNFITAREVIDEVGADALRFLMLCRKNDTPFDFDLSKVVEQSKDNPIFYVQYAHARCCSVLKNAQEFFSKNMTNSDELKYLCQKNIDFLEVLNDESELELIKKIANYLRIIEMSAQYFEPHRLAFYLQELAGDFHALWNKGSENPQLKFIIKDNLNLTYARLCLVFSLKKIIASGLEIFSITPCEEMK